MNSQQPVKKYTVLTRLFHWISAVLVLGLFALGFWMVDLSYYHEWYKTAPDLHKSIGIVLFIVTVARTINKQKQPKLINIDSIAPIQQQAATLMHGLLYILLFTLFISGYLISTADGRGIEVFGLIELPALMTQGETQSELAGLIHEYVAYVLIGLVSVHALAALKHHIINKNDILKRML